MVRAAAGGVIDFSKANPFDRSWYIRRNLLLEAYETQLEYEYLKCRLTKQLALVSSPNIATPDVAKSALEESNDLLQRLLEITLCQKLGQTDHRRETAKVLRAAWEQSFGSLNDSKVQAQIDDVVLQLRARRKDARTAQ